MSYITSRFDDEVERLLKAGKVGFMPSDTIYGLSCRALDKKAVQKLRRVKKRSAAKRFIVLVSDLDQLTDLGLSQAEAKTAVAYWPGPVSLEMWASKSPIWLRLTAETFAVRMPGSRQLLRLINRVGPITSTSANYEGEEPVRNAKEAVNKFGEQLDFYVDAGELAGLPSTMVRPVDGKLEVIRQGSVTIKKEDLA